MKDKIIDITNSTEKLKELILANPDLPIIVMASYEGCSDNYYWTYCSNVTFNVGEYMSYDILETGEVIIDDRDYFEERLSDKLADDPEYEHLSEQEFDTLIEEKMREYEKYWVKAIFICADN